MSHQTLAVVAFLGVAALVPPAGAQRESMPPGMSHQEHMAEMNKRGTLAMGFDQKKATHHFQLTGTGGSIEVAANRPGDAIVRQQIREHLKTISQDFANGVFASPIATHAEAPPGVSVMRERKTLISYGYEETSNGARVIISTTDRTARTAVHDFLRYQIREHATGDPVTVGK
jgi:hypothetical protein